MWRVKGLTTRNGYNAQAVNLTFCEYMNFEYVRVNPQPDVSRAEARELAEGVVCNR